MAIKLRRSQSSNKYETTFSDADLINGNLLVTHNLNAIAMSVSVFDNNGEEFYPSKVKVNNPNTLTLEMSDYTPISGTYSLNIQS